VRAFSIMYNAYLNRHLFGGAVVRIQLLHEFMEHMYQRVSLFPDSINGKSLKELFPCDLPLYYQMCDVILNVF